jgi:hypothetical protein
MPRFIEPSLTTLTDKEGEEAEGDLVQTARVGGCRISRVRFRGRYWG